MVIITIHNVAEIAASDRAVLERLVGKPLLNGQQVVLQVVTPGVADESTRDAARASLARTLGAAAEGATERGVTAGEADAAVEEAMRHVRPRFE